LGQVRCKTKRWYLERFERRDSMILDDERLNDERIVGGMFSFAPIGRNVGEQVSNDQQYMSTASYKLLT
jgi:hypothetical protein